MSENVTLFAAFVAGILSFVSPCVLPLIPGYVSFVSGVSLDDMRGESAAVSPSRRHVIITSLFFVLGFSLVFIALGATASVLGKFLFARQPLLGQDRRRPADRLRPPHDGRLPASACSRTRSASRPSGSRRGRSARCWSESRSRSDGRRASVRSLAASWRLPDRRTPSSKASNCSRSTRSGLGIPFLLTSIAINQFFAATKRIRKHYHAIELVSGGLLVVIGVLIFTNQFTLIVRYLQPYLPVY